MCSRISIPSKTLEVNDEAIKSLIYLPEEGLQGEDIPSHILWENAKVKTIRISIREPMKIKHVFNAQNYKVQNNNIIIDKIELEGYVGLSFKTTKVSDLEIVVPLDYCICLLNGGMIRKTKKIRLFRPHLNVKTENEEVTVNPNTGFVRGRVKVKNIGRGTILMAISETENSSIKLQPSPEYSEFAEKFLSDLYAEMEKLAKRFPQFQQILKEMQALEGIVPTDLLNEEQDKLKGRLQGYSNDLSAILANDRDLLRGFVDAYRKALSKNSELIELFRRFVKVYESLVSKDILLMNPFDDVVLTGKREDICLEIAYTDRVFDTYEDITLPKIYITSSDPIRLPLHKLFEWG